MIASCLVRRKTSKNYIFDYLIPNELGTIESLSLVEVFFNNRKTDALVIEVKNQSPQAKQPVLRKLTSGSAISKKQLDLAEKIAHEFLSDLPSAVFDFIPKLNKSDLKNISFKKNTASGKKPEYIFLEGSYPERLNYYAQKINKEKQNLVILPEISQIKFAIKTFNKLDPSIEIYPWHSQLSSKEKRIVLQKLQSGENLTVISARHGLFLPFTRLENIFLDQSQNFAFFEDQEPSYNAYKLALIATSIYKNNLIIGDSIAQMQILTAILKKRFKKIKLKNEISISLCPSLKNIFSNQKFLEDFKSSKRMLVLGYFKEITRFICQDCEKEIACGCKNNTFRDKSLLCIKCSAPVPVNCPQCKSTKIKKIGMSFSKMIQKLEQVFGKNSVSGEITEGKIIVKSINELDKIESIYDLVLIPFFDYYSSLPYLNITSALIRTIMDIRITGASRVYLSTDEENETANLLVRRDIEKILLKELFLRQGEKMPPFTRYLEIENVAKIPHELSSIIDEKLWIKSKDKFITFAKHSKVKVLQDYYQKKKPGWRMKLDSPDFV
ncbi:MAG: hypothetical protein ABH810_03235 [bacterium]